MDKYTDEYLRRIYKECNSPETRSAPFKNKFLLDVYNQNFNAESDKDLYLHWWMVLAVLELVTKEMAVRFAKL